MHFSIKSGAHKLGFQALDDSKLPSNACSVGLNHSVYYYDVGSDNHEAAVTSASCLLNINMPASHAHFTQDVERALLGSRRHSC